eukprot:scaffold163401_cov18-Tisochrysis_lutea.AAC.1
MQHAASSCNKCLWQSLTASCNKIGEKRRGMEGQQEQQEQVTTHPHCPCRNLAPCLGPIFGHTHSFRHCAWTDTSRRAHTHTHTHMRARARKGCLWLPTKIWPTKRASSCACLPYLPELKLHSRRGCCNTSCGGVWSGATAEVHETSAGMRSMNTKVRQDCCSNFLELRHGQA